MFPYERGHFIILGINRHVILEVTDSEVYLVHISDPLGINGKWVLQKLLPIPIGKMDVEKLSKKRFLK
jgi:hypothetical protein